MDVSIEILHLSLGLVLLWMLFYWCWSSYRVDALRQRLFTIRDELFVFAAAGAIAFDHPAYTQLRATMNGMIRFAHRVSFLRLAFSIILTPRRVTERFKLPYFRWRDAVNSLESPRLREQLLEFDNRMTVVVVRHMVTGSSLCTASLVLFVIWQAIHGVFRSVLRAFAFALPGVELLEAQALEAQALAATGGKRRGSLATAP